MSDRDDMAVAARSAARQLASTRRLIDDSRRAMRVIKEHCQAMQRRIEESRALLQGQVQPVPVVPVVPVTRPR